MALRNNYYFLGGEDIFNLKSEKSFLYRIALPIMQAIVAILLILALIFNNTLENLSDILRNTTIAIQIFILIILGIKELLINKSKIKAYLCFGLIFVGLIFVVLIFIYNLT